MHSPYLHNIHAAFSAECDSPLERRSFYSLLLLAHKHTGLLTDHSVYPSLTVGQDNAYIGALRMLARHCNAWRRFPEEWRHNGHNLHRQFSSLARHLLADYHVPAFMDIAWFEGTTPEGRTHQKWFGHIGEGKNIRTTALPMSLTSRGAHLFILAPNDLSIEAAMRWGQARAIGADERLCRALIGTRLRKSQPDEAFWLGVLHFFVNNPMLDPDMVGPIVDFLHSRKFVAREMAGPDGLPIHRIPEPGLTMKGRTATALLRRVEEWHRELHREVRNALMEWKPRPDLFPMNDYAVHYPDTGQTALWSVAELTSRVELHEEGKAMRHCVASYDRACARGTISIWSVRVHSGPEDNVRRVMTLEIDNNRRAVVQARGRFNRASDGKQAGLWLQCAPEVLKIWAAREKLGIAVRL